MTALDEIQAGITRLADSAGPSVVGIGQNQRAAARRGSQGVWARRIFRGLRTWSST